MAVPAMSSIIAASSAARAAKNNSQEETRRKKTDSKKPSAKMPSMSKPAEKKSKDPSKTKPFNVRPIKPAEIIKDKPATKKAAAKPAPKSGPMRRPTMADRIQDAKNVQPKGPAKPKTTVKAPVKKKVLVMPDKISPSKMTPAQKARYLKNPERYDG